MRPILISFILLSVFIVNSANAQSSDSTITVAQLPKNWFNLDPEEDSILGVSTEKAYRTLLKNKPSKNVVVAVIDSGVDIEHEDLQGAIWVNKGEIAGNGIDDDKNGYIDDVNGWNFIGNPNGENITSDSYELTREYTRLMSKFEKKDSLKQRRKNKEQFKYYQELEKQFNEKKEKVVEEYQQFNSFRRNYTYAKGALIGFTKIDTLSVEVLNDSLFINAPEQIIQIRDFYISLLAHGFTDEQMTEWQEHLEKQLNYGYNPNFDPRDLVGDDYGNIDEKYYGNNNVEGPDAMHGTHVAGIIAAKRNNGLGIKGIADNVSIMAVRAVPDGDERDKDVANAIYYAVDNGAQIINMSFGKSHSPHKKAVDKAVKYAEEKGVLLIHAAGNSSDNIDITNNFPTKKFLDDQETSQLWVEVGASNSGLDNKFVGSFSNYGKEMVTVFAPGCEIMSTTPNNKYQALDGTSMASPVTAGVAALLLSYYPELTPQQVKHILLNSAKKYNNLTVIKPTTKEEKEEVLFSELSSSAAIVNAYEAIKMAESMKIDGNN